MACQSCLIKRTHSFLRCLQALFRGLGGKKILKKNLLGPLGERLVFTPGAVEGGRHEGPGNSRRPLVALTGAEQQRAFTAEKPQKTQEADKSETSHWVWLKEKFFHSYRSVGKSYTMGKKICGGKKCLWFCETRERIKSDLIKNRLLMGLFFLNWKILFNSLIFFSSFPLVWPWVALNTSASSADSKDQAVSTDHLSIFLSFPPPSTSPSVCPRPPSLPPIISIFCYNPASLFCRLFSPPSMSHSALNKSDEKNYHFFIALPWFSSHL